MRRGHSLYVGAVPVHRMPVAGSRQVQVCERQRDEAERKRCESHNPPPSAARPALDPLSFLYASPLRLSQATRRSQHPFFFFFFFLLVFFFQVPSYLNDRLDPSDFSLLTCSSTQIPLRREPCGHLTTCVKSALDFFSFFWCALFQSAPSRVR